MDSLHRVLVVMSVMLAMVLGGCSSGSGNGESGDSGTLEAGRGEHDRDGPGHDHEGRGEHGGGGHDEEGEESGTELSLDARYDQVRNGARLILAYDAASNAFTGTMENTTEKTLRRVRVEVHLSNGKELGPTTPADLAPGEKRAVKLAGTEKKFDGWTAHPEVGSGEHGHGEGGEHGREGGREHGGEHR